MYVILFYPSLGQNSFYLFVDKTNSPYDMTYKNLIKVKILFDWLIKLSVITFSNAHCILSFFNLYKTPLLNKHVFSTSTNHSLKLFLFAMNKLHYWYQPNLLYWITVKLGYNEPLGAAKFVGYNWEFIITWIVSGVNT